MYSTVIVALQAFRFLLCAGFPAHCWQLKLIMLFTGGFVLLEEFSQGCISLVTFSF